MHESEASWIGKAGKFLKKGAEKVKDVGQSVLDGTATGRVSKIEKREAKMVDKVMATE
jgi:hypothetical protein